MSGQCTLSGELHFSSRPTSFKKRLLTKFDALIGTVLPPSKVLFVDSYFSFHDFVKLSLRLRQFPRLYRSDFESEHHKDKGRNRPPDRALIREKLASIFNPETTFEAFLLKIISEEIPFIHVEGFPQLLSKVNRIRLNPRTVLTANAHYANELFKLWVAERNLQGGKYVTMEHGTSIPPAFNTMSFEEDTAEVKTTWASPYHEKHVQMPPNKRASIKIKSHPTFLAVLGYEMPRYHFRADATPKSGQIHVHLEMIQSLYSSLDFDVQSELRIRPYPNSGWNTRQRLIDQLGARAISDEPDYYRFLSRAKLIVCTYPQTTFSESMATGIPTILMYPPHLWETIAQMNPLIETLRDAKIIFYDSISAAGHINTIWRSPMEWWNAPPTQSARKIFLESTFNLDGDWVDHWANFLNRMTR